MKKLLAMVLALVMTLSLAVSANAAFKDEKDISDEYAEAVAVLNGMGVFKGYEDETFKPEGKITRAEVATIIYRIYTADVAKNDKSGMYATYNKFSDMAGAGWAAGYIGYCANAELVKGYPNGTFQPSGNVTGYEVLAMILRAVGYDKNGEFTGADWALNVAKYAEQAGVLKNIKGVDLNAPATRELVAEMLFRGIADAATVTYTPAFGYQTEKVQKLDKVTLGSKNFKLADKDASDDWGRPGTKWTYNTGDEETLVLKKAAATYTTKVDECDIAKDLGISKSKAIEAAYIDGDKKDITDAAVTTNQVGTINALATTSYVGGQGRLTEVYDMGSDGYRIVEINTYLAKVDKVTAAKTDRNGHTTKATVDLTVYAGLEINKDTKKETLVTFDFDGVKAEGFTVDQYVLVTVLHPAKYDERAAKNGASVESIVAAELVAGGKLTGWTNEVGTTAATHVVAGTTYNDANKFFLNRRAAGTTWLVALDSYGNAIGLVENASSYAAVARIEWRPNANSFGGYALADLVLADGTLKENVTVASVNDKAVNAAGAEGNTYTKGLPSKASVSIAWQNNEDYYNHILTYSVNADGSYNLKYVNHGTEVRHDDIVDVSDVDYKSGSATLDYFTATNSTVFAYQNDNGYSYTVYTGKDKAPSFTDGTICVKVDSNGYAEFVLVTDYTVASNTFLAYVTNKPFTNLTYPGDKTIPGYTVYKIGTDEKTVVYDAQWVNDEVEHNTKFWNAFKKDGAGLYEIEVTDDMFVKEMKLVVASASKFDNQYAPFDYDFAAVGSVWHDMDGDSLQLLDDEGNFYKFNVAADTPVFKVTKYMNETVLEKGSVADITKDSKILFVYDDNSSKTATKLDVKVVYVLETVEDVEDVTKYTVSKIDPDEECVYLDSDGALVVDNLEVAKTVNGKVDDTYDYGTAKITAKFYKETENAAGDLSYKFVKTVKCESVDSGDGEIEAYSGNCGFLVDGVTYKVELTITNAEGDFTKEITALVTAK